mmetsp:Transcript_141548/g.271749  ORF Transcript_141548/g.271749 Transcript_141548/m.271749 type:complete len:241 (+) Transcript_141548:1138-1860(+)
MTCSSPSSRQPTTKLELQRAFLLMHDQKILHHRVPLWTTTQMLELFAGSLQGCYLTVTSLMMRTVAMRIRVMKKSARLAMPICRRLLRRPRVERYELRRRWHHQQLLSLARKKALQPQHKMYQKRQLRLRWWLLTLMQNLRAQRAATPTRTMMPRASASLRLSWTWIRCLQLAQHCTAQANASAATSSLRAAARMAKIAPFATFPTTSASPAARRSVNVGQHGLSSSCHKEGIRSCRRIC